MKNNKGKKQANEGITLIALVITVIVMLILAGVAINLTIGDNGIFKKSDEGAQIYKNAANNEASSLNEADTEMGSLIDKYKEENGGGNKTLAKDVLKTDATATEAALKSPYVRYNGLDCRVLYNDETHGLQIITAENIEDVTLGYDDAWVEATDFTYDGTCAINDNFKKAAASYNNVVDNLNNKAKTYMDKKGIATDARCLGSIPTLGSTLKFQGDISEMWVDGPYGYMTRYGWNNKVKTTDTNYKEDVKKLKDLGLISMSSWLASREVSNTSSMTRFEVRFVNRDGIAVSDNLCTVYADDGLAVSYTKSFGFRPVFLLSSDVVVNGGDGSSVNPYVIE